MFFFEMDVLDVEDETELLLVKCKRLTIIPVLSSLTMLDIYDCPNLQSLPSFPNLKKLFIKCSYEISTISYCPQLEIVEISDCFKLSNLLLPSTLHQLFLSNISGTIHFPKTEMNQLVCLHLRNIPFVRFLPHAPKLENLWLDSCLQITEIPYKHLFYFYCFHCPYIIKFPLNHQNFLECDVGENTYMYVPPRLVKRLNHSNLSTPAILQERVFFLRSFPRLYFLKKSVQLLPQLPYELCELISMFLYI